jgi:multimeric flavodoxin WrbA
MTPPLHAVIFNCTLKREPRESNTEVLCEKAEMELRKLGVETDIVRVVSYNVLAGTSSNEGEGDDWPTLFSRIRHADIFILASPVWVGHLGSVAQRVIERLDSIFHEEELADPETGQFLTYNKVAGALVTGNEDGAHSSVAQILWAMQEFGFTVPPNANSYWVGPAGPGPSYLEAGGPEWEYTNANYRYMVHNLVYFAGLLKQNPIPTNLKALRKQATETKR